MTTQTKDAKGVAAQLTTPEFRVSYPWVFEAQEPLQPGGPKKFSVVMLFRTKADPKKPQEKVVDITPLKQAAMAVVVAKLGPDQAKWPKGLRIPFRDGKEKDTDGYGDGIIFVSASSKRRPGLVDKNLQAILEPSEFYGGCYARATIAPFYYDRAGNRGVSFGLRNVQKLRDGDPFSGGKAAEDDFDAIAGDDGPTASTAGTTASKTTSIFDI